MTLVRWRPYRDFFNLQDRINRLFENDLFPEKSSEDVALSSWTPTTDIFETKDEYVLKLEVPGISKDDIQIDFNQETLTIKGERKEEKEVKKDEYHRIERCSGSFTRSFSLPKNVDEKKIDASMKDGILELRIPKKEESKAKAIPIKVK
jgi:HSP20 family protein